jgi:hypothetical protein
MAGAAARVAAPADAAELQDSRILRRQRERHCAPSIGAERTGRWGARGADDCAVGRARWMQLWIVAGTDELGVWRCERLRLDRSRSRSGDFPFVEHVVTG